MTISARGIIRDAAIVYSLTFATGLGMALVGVNLQNNPSTAYIVNLLSGAIGFTDAGIRVARNRTEHLAWVAAAVWICNLANVVFGIQTSASWIRSGLTLIFMAALGGIFAMIFTLASSSHRRTYAGRKEGPAPKANSK